MVAKGENVFVHYRGTLDDGREFDGSYRYGAPLQVAYGEDDMLPGLSAALANMQPGDTYTVRIPAEEAYGAYDEGLVEAVPAAAFPRADSLPVGEYIEIKTPRGPLKVKVLKVEDGQVYFDHNHELAGQALNFEITLVSPEQAEAELAASMPSNQLSGWNELEKILGSPRS